MSPAATTVVEDPRIPVDSTVLPLSARQWRQAQDAARRGGLPPQVLTDPQAGLLRSYGVDMDPSSLRKTFHPDDLARIELIDGEAKHSTRIDDLFGFKTVRSSKDLPRPDIQPQPEQDPADAAPVDEDLPGDESSSTDAGTVTVDHARIIPVDDCQVRRNRSHALSRFDLTCGPVVVGDIPVITYQLDRGSDNAWGDGTGGVRIRWHVPEAVEAKNDPRRSSPSWDQVMRSGWWRLSTRSWSSPFVMVDVDSDDALMRYKTAVEDGMPPASYVILNQENGHAQFFWIIPPFRKTDDDGLKNDAAGLAGLVSATLTWRLDGDLNARDARCRNPFYVGSNSSLVLGFDAYRLGLLDVDGETPDDGGGRTVDHDGSHRPVVVRRGAGSLSADSSSDGASKTAPCVSVFYPDSESDGGIHVWSLRELYYELSALGWIKEGRAALRSRRVSSGRRGAGSLFDGTSRALDPSCIDGPVPEGCREVAAFRVATWALWSGGVEEDVDAVADFVSASVVFADGDKPFTYPEIKGACSSAVRFHKRHYDKKLAVRRKKANGGDGTDGSRGRRRIGRKIPASQVDRASVDAQLEGLGFRRDGNDDIIDTIDGHVVCTADELVVEEKTGRLLDPYARKGGLKGGSRGTLAQRVARAENLAKGRVKRKNEGEDGLTDNERLLLQIISEIRAGESMETQRFKELDADDAKAIEKALENSASTGILAGGGESDPQIPDGRPDQPQIHGGGEPGSSLDPSGGDGLRDDGTSKMVDGRDLHWEDEPVDVLVRGREDPNHDGGSDSGSLDDSPYDHVSLMAEPVADERAKVLDVLNRSYSGKMSRATFYRTYKKVVDSLRWRLVREVWGVIKKSFRPWESKEWTPESDHWSRPLFWLGRISCAVALQLAPQLERIGYARAALSCVEALRSVVRFVDRRLEDRSLWVMAPILEIMKHVYIDNALDQLDGIEDEEDIVLPVTLDRRSSGGAYDADGQVKAVPWMDRGDGRRVRHVDRNDFGQMGVLADYVEWASVALRDMMGKIWVEQDHVRHTDRLKGTTGFDQAVDLLLDSSLSLKAVQDASTGGGEEPTPLGLMLAEW